MADVTYRNENAMEKGPRADWGAIWAGVFTFIAIWSVFGLLGIAIFGKPGNPAANPLMGVTLGMDIWEIVLTIIAMYVAGRETGRLAAVSNRHDGLIHGMIMFGLSVIAVALLAVVGGGNTSAGTGPINVMHSGYLAGLSVNLAWTGFLSMFFGWLAAMGGASTGAQRRSQPERTPQQNRPAA